MICFGWHRRVFDAQEAAIVAIVHSIELNHFIDSRLNHSTKRCIEYSLREVGDMGWYAFAK